MTQSGAAPAEFLSAVDLRGPLDAVLLLKRTGVTLAAWTRDPVRIDVITVMAATLIGSLVTMVEALGGPNPQVTVIDAGAKRMLAARVDSHTALFLVAPRGVSELLLREEAQRLVRRLSEIKAHEAAKAAGPSSRTLTAK